MQNERHGNAKRHANAQRGSANQHADYDRIQLSVTVVDCRLLVIATGDTTTGSATPQFNWSRGIDRVKTEATPKQSAAAKVIVSKGSQA